MSVALPDVRVGEPLRYKSMTVFPLFAESGDDVEYQLASEAIAENSLTVEEVSETGSVPELLVENKGDTRVLFIEGEELVGAKQNRILNTSILIAAKSKTKVPVSCVEQGRWSYKSRQFGSSGSHTSSKLRHTLKRSVSHAVMAGAGHSSDQAEVWNAVDNLLCCVGSASPSAAMSAAFEDRQDDISDYRDHLKYVAGARGMAVAVGAKVLGFDLFDKPDTCSKVWDRILSGCVMDAISEPNDESRISIEDVEAWIGSSATSDWKRVDAVGEGEEYRAEIERDHGSALTFTGTLVHESIVAG